MAPNESLIKEIHLSPQGSLVKWTAARQERKERIAIQPLSPHSLPSIEELRSQIPDGRWTHELLEEVLGVEKFRLFAICGL
jgi:hypothetical protein